MSNSIPVFIKEIFILRIAVISILLREQVQFLPVFNLSCFIKFYASSLSIQLIGQYFLESFSSKFFSRVCYITYYNYKQRWVYFLHFSLILCLSLNVVLFSDRCYYSVFSLDIYVDCAGLSKKLMDR